jgi:hypothetical protein
MTPNIKITARQIRFIFDSGKVWMIQPLHIVDGVPEGLRGYYYVPSVEWQNCGWGSLNAKKEKTILRKWVSLGFKL